MDSRFRILGHTRLRIGDRLDDQWGPRKLRGILAVLLLHPGQSIPFDVVVQWAWPDGRGPRDLSTFYTYAKRIRTALLRMDRPPDLVIKSGAFRLDVEREEIDFFQFRAIVARARATADQRDPTAVVQEVTRALDLWLGIMLADADGDRASDWRRSADTMHLLPALDTLMQALSELGRFDEVLHRMADLSIEHRSNLTMVKRHLEALHGSKRHNERTTYFLAARKRFMAEFDLDEANELKAYYDNLVRPEPEQQPAASAATGVDSTSVESLTPDMLPHDVADFTGRDDLFAQLDAMAITTTGDVVRGIVSLVGPPGVGKTALAVHWAHRVAHRFVDGILFADLNGFASGPKVEPAELVDNFLAALGFPVERVPSGTGRVAKLRSLLSGKRTLVVLDNARDSAHVLPLLDSLSPSLLVVTSRHRLGALTRRGALDIIVPPLPFGQGRAWLADRMGARGVREPDAVAELTAMCGGSPLALRGMADRIATRPKVRLSEFVYELRSTPVLLGLGDDGDGADGSVRTIFSWSYRTLAIDDQQMFRLLGVHPGPDISLDAAAALAGRDRSSTKKSLDNLISAHLLTQPESLTRYRFHDIVRKYAAECAGLPAHQAERSAAEARLLSYYLHTANNADAAVFPYRPRVPMLPLVDSVTPQEFVDEGSAIDWCVRERANLNSVIWLARRKGAHEYAYRLPSATGEILHRLGFYEDIFAGLRTAIKSARIAGDVEGEAYSLCNLGYVYLSIRDFDSAEPHFQAAREKFTRLGSQLDTAAVMYHQARLQVERGKVQEGIEAYLVALDALRRAGNDSLEINAMYRLAEAYRRAGNLGAATAYARDALWLSTKVGEVSGQGCSLTELGAVSFELGDLGPAKDYLIRALNTHQRVRAPAHASRTLNLLAQVHRDEGDTAEAERCAQQALDLAKDVRDSRGQATAHDLLGQLAFGQGRPDEAAEYWGMAKAILTDLADPHAQVISARLAELPATPLDVPPTRTEPLTPAPWPARANYHGE